MVCPIIDMFDGQINTCSRNCDKDCLCVMNGFRCTPACKLQECTNMQDDDDDDDGSSDLDESDSDIDEE